MCRNTFYIFDDYDDYSNSYVNEEGHFVNMAFFGIGETKAIWYGL